MSIMQELQTKVDALVKEARSGVNSEQIGPNIEKLRKDHAKKLEAVLTDDQKNQWKELLGPPFELGD
jgi:plasmid stabilization system protein ParE